MKRSRDIDSQTSLEDLAHIVYGQLESHGIDAVLTGGAVVSIYSANRYQSYDLDFVAGAGRKELAKILAPLGFADKGRRHSKSSVAPLRYHTESIRRGPIR